MKRFIAVICVLSLTFGISVQTVFSAGLKSETFNPNFIIDDANLLDSRTMSEESIQRFLKAKGGVLWNYKAIDVDGGEKSAAAIIAGAANRNGINPQFLIVLLQKEQSLIENPNPSQIDFDWATGFAVCDSCSKDDPGLLPFRGFANQINRAAARQRYYLDHPYEFRVRVGEPILIDGELVTPVTRATANLYIYTPHLNGNRNFWKIWNDYFDRIYPDGTLLKERGTDNVWIVEGGKLRLVSSRAALLTDYNATAAVEISTSDLLQYDIGVPVRHPNYSLLRIPTGGVYLLVDGTTRAITSREVLRGLGFNPDEIVSISLTELADYVPGDPIVSADAPPIGELIQDKTTGGVYYLEAGFRHRIASREILKTRFSRYPIRQLSAEEILKYPDGAPVGFRDGQLVAAKGDSSVYVITRGEKRLIPSPDVFLDLGYRWSNIVYTSADALTDHPTGPAMTL